MDSFKDYYQDVQVPRTAVLSYGRFNPPTTGHDQLIQKVQEIAGRENAEGFIVPTHTSGNEKNPLTLDEKSAILGEMIGDSSRLQVGSFGKTLISTLQRLQKDGYNRIIHVAGSDRIPDFERLIEAYNGKPDKKGNIPFKFDEYIMESSGERDPDSEGVAGMSASKLRELAIEGNIDAFKAGMAPQVSDGMKEFAYNTIRKRSK